MFVGSYISPFTAVSLASIVCFGVIWFGFWWPRRSGGYFYFDPQDCAKACETPAGAKAKSGRRVFPISAKNSTFLPFLDHYIGVTKLMITVAAASIAFGGDRNQAHEVFILVAKLLLAWSILVGVFFCVVLLWRYDEYAQDMERYTACWYSTVFASGFASLFCFIAGYIAWGWGLQNGALAGR